LKSFEERKSEVDVLKKSLRTANIDLETYKKDLQGKNKCIKEKKRKSTNLSKKV
jgi:hypothetical protein